MILSVVLLRAGIIIATASCPSDYSAMVQDQFALVAAIKSNLETWPGDEVACTMVNAPIALDDVAGEMPLQSAWLDEVQS